MRRVGVEFDHGFYNICKKMTREHRIPFEVSVDPFYSDANIEYLERITKEIDEKGTVLEQHSILEE